jgi:TetR/AcrR family transcriptional regulator, regulator of cefoperazone and chloramphenicol sensitivity
MASSLEKAKQNPDSMKAKILTAARKIFGEYGFHGTTTRMIAKAVNIDISTLYYHWGEKGDLYEAVIRDISEGLRHKLVEVEKIVKGRPLAERLEIAIDEMSDYLFANPEISNLTLFRYFTRPGTARSLISRFRNTSAILRIQWDWQKTGRTFPMMRK